jgi:hypothetical protein
MGFIERTHYTNFWDYRCYRDFDQRAWTLSLWNTGYYQKDIVIQKHTPVYRMILCDFTYNNNNNIYMIPTKQYEIPTLREIVLDTTDTEIVNSRRMITNNYTLNLCYVALPLEWYYTRNQSFKYYPFILCPASSFGRIWV